MNSSYYFAYSAVELDPERHMLQAYLTDNF